MLFRRLAVRCFPVHWRQPDQHAVAGLETFHPTYSRRVVQLKIRGLHSPQVVEMCVADTLHVAECQIDSGGTPPAFPKCSQFEGMVRCQPEKREFMHVQKAVEGR